MNYIIKRCILILIVLFNIRFFQFNLFDGGTNILKISSFLILLLILLLSKVKAKTLPYKNLITYYFIGLLISTFMCYFYWNQSIVVSLLTLKSFYALLFYYGMHKLRPTIKDVNFVIFFLAISYSICYIINIINYPNLIFGTEGVFRRNVLTFNFVGWIFLIYAFIYSFYKVFNQRNFVYGFFIFLFLIFIVLKSSRSAFFALFLGILIQNLLIGRFTIKRFINFILLIISLIPIYFILSESISLIIEKTGEDFSLGEDYIRIQTTYYYVFEHSKSFMNLIFGNGYPSSKSEYGNFIFNDLWYKRGYYAEDIGIIGFWSYFGLFTTFIYFAILKRLLKKFNPTYIKVFAFYLLFMSITTYEFYTQDSLILQPFLFYISDLHFFKTKQHDS